MLRTKAFLLATAALLLGSSQTLLALNPFAPCALVPAASFSDSEDTAVGLISKSEGTVHWLFFNQDGERLDTDSFTVAQDQFNAFVMSSTVAPELRNTQGFLLFCLDANEDDIIDFRDDENLTANAFLVKPASNDVVYLPVLPVFAGDLDFDVIDDEIDQWTDDPIDTLSLTATAADELYMRYFIDGAVNSGARTRIFLFTTRSPDGSEAMLAVGPQTSTTVQVPLEKARLNIIDVESIDEMDDPELVGSGFLRWQVEDNIRSAYAFAIVESPAFGAAQTLIGSVDLD